MSAINNHMKIYIGMCVRKYIFPVSKWVNVLKKMNEALLTYRFWHFSSFVCVDHRVPAVRSLCGLVGVWCAAVRDVGWTGETKFQHHRRASRHLAVTAVMFITEEEVFGGGLLLHFITDSYLFMKRSLFQISHCIHYILALYACW